MEGRWPPGRTAHLCTGRSWLRHEEAGLACVCLLRVCLLWEANQPQCKKRSSTQVCLLSLHRLGCLSLRGVRLCWNKQLRTDLVDEAVWNEVCKLLEDPSRLEQEYRPISIPKVCTIVGGVVALVLALVSAAVIVPVKRVR